MKKNRYLVLLVLFVICIGSGVFADGLQIPNIELSVGGEEGGLTSTVQIIILLTVLTLAPSIIILTTCFTRIIIIFSFMRKALALQSTPPNQVLIGLALFLTLFIMGPVFTEIYNDAYLPMSNGQINQEVAYQRGIAPLREFMFKQVRTEDLALFVELSETQPTSLEEVSTAALIPAFVISEMKTGFIVGFMLFIPFIVIDMVVASTLMALGMMMLPPVMISLPFKVLLFIMIDGWNLLIRAIIMGISV